MNILRFHFLLLVLLGVGSITAQAAQLASAKVLEITGTANKYNASGQDTPLNVGDILTEGDAVVTTALSTATLAFSNGSILTIEENTSLSLATLKQEPFSGNRSYEQLEADPSVSTNLLELNYGKVSGEVKKLRQGSNFNVETPIGTAAIRGTIFSVELVYNATRNEMILVVTNVNGIVDVISRYAGDLDFGRGTTGDTGYDSTQEEEKRATVPPRHKVIIRLSHRDPYYDDIINAINNYPPFQSNGRPPVIITIPGKPGGPTTPGTPGNPGGPGDDNEPPFIPDDPGVIIISPEGPN